MRNHTPIRMCIVCKERFEQRSLFRFKIISGNIEPHFKCGRSFYLCSICILKEDKILQKAFSKMCKNLTMKITQQDLKEIFLDGKS